MTWREAIRALATELRARAQLRVPGAPIVGRVEGTPRVYNMLAEELEGLCKLPTREALPVLRRMASSELPSSTQSGKS